MAEVGNLLEKITDPVTIMIRVVGLMADVSNLCENFYDFFIFLECPSKILGGFTWKLKKKKQGNTPIE